MALLMVTSAAVSVSAWLRVIGNWSMPSQGRSVFRPAGSSRSPSAAVWSAAVCVPQPTETASSAAGVNS